MVLGVSSEAKMKIVFQMIALGLIVLASPVLKAGGGPPGKSNVNDIKIMDGTEKKGKRMEPFQSSAASMIAAMENHARKLGVKGVIVVASMDDSSNSWVSQMKAVDVIKALDDRPEQHQYPGYNFIAIAYSKAAEMADTKLNSGSKVRPAYQGEFGYEGGVIKKLPSGYFLAVFSGATSEQDLEIAKVGMSACQIE
jgi:hypothetical protein